MYTCMEMEEWLTVCCLKSDEFWFQSISSTNKAAVDLLYLFSCVTGTVQVSDGLKFIPRGPHAGHLCFKTNLESNGYKTCLCFTLF